MNLENFNNLSDQDKENLLNVYTENEETIKNRDIEISSLKKELEDTKSVLNLKDVELTKTKELNYTLSRQFDASNKKTSFEDALHNLMKGDK